MVSSQTVKGICCIISAICMHLIIGNVYTWGNINVYYVSYVRLTEKSFSLMDGFFMVPVLQLVSQLLTSVGGYYEKYTGPRIFNVGAIITAISCHVLLYFFTNYFVIMLAMALYGVTFGTGYFPMLKQCWKYFPEKKGLITGIILSCVGISTFLFTSLADWMINPEGKSPTIDNDYFEEAIAIKTKDFILAAIIILSCLGLISSCLMFPYVEEAVVPTETLPTENQQEEKHKEDEENKSENPPEYVYVQKERVKEVVRTVQFYLLGIMATGIACFSFLVSNTNRTFGTINKLDETLLQTLSKVYALLNGLTRFIWGYIFDKVPFKILYTVVIINHMTCAFSYFFAGQNGTAYFIVNCFVACSFAAHATFFNPVMVHMFGIKNSVIIIGFYNLVIGIFGLLNPILCKFYIKETNDFLLIYMIGGTFVLGSFISLMILKPEKYVYTWKSVREQEEERKSIGAAPLLRDSDTGSEPNPYPEEN